MLMCRVVNKESCAVCRMCCFAAEGYSKSFHDKSIIEEKEKKETAIHS